MPVQIRYMGAKHDLAPLVASVVRDLPGGPLLDLFAGMCSVAGQLAQTRRTAWCNDVQRYAYLVASALLANKADPPGHLRAALALGDLFVANVRELSDTYERELRAESRALERGVSSYQRLHENWRHVGNDASTASEALRLSRRPAAKPYRLATLTFAYGYFGLRQSIELDSIRFAIDEAFQQKRVTKEERDYLLVALLQTCSHVASAPGHFAEFLRPHSERAFARIRAARAHAVWPRFLGELGRIRPYGTSTWRATNRVYRSTADDALSHLSRSAGTRPSVVYADPPYSRAQYSRYYHVLETMTLYDYPTVTGIGRYRDDRYQTEFSQIGRVAGAFKRLANGVARIGAALVVSYPSNGLLYETGEDLLRILQTEYRAVTIAVRAQREHSTLGAARGTARKEVEELIFVATRPRAA